MTHESLMRYRTKFDYCVGVRPTKKIGGFLMNAINISHSDPPSVQGMIIKNLILRLISEET